MGCYICDPTNPNAATEGCSGCEASYVNQVVIPLGISAGERAPDEWTDYDAAYAQFSAPHRGGILSDQERRNPKISRERLRKDARAILWALHWACRDLVSARSWGYAEATEAQRLRNRVVKLFSLLTDEQKDVMRSWDEAARADLKRE